MNRVVVFTYRDWGHEIIKELNKGSNIHIVEVIESNESFHENVERLIESSDMFLFLGWSWKVDDTIIMRHLCLGIHPSDLPQFKGGSPIQNQIIKGLTQTQSTLMILSPNSFDEGPIVHKAPLSLNGNCIAEVFDNIVYSTVGLLTDFFDNVDHYVRNARIIEGGFTCKRRKPNESKINNEPLSPESLIDLYNHIRCLTDPYPNAYYEDTLGNRLLIKQVEYKKISE
jgi:methionyl-tRNA formyltransferase